MPPPTATSRSPARTAWSIMPDGAHARGAHLVDRLRGDLLRDPGLDLRLARGDLPLPGLQHRAHDDVLDLLGRDVGALERRLDGDAAELVASRDDESAAELADRRAGGAEDHGSRHGRRVLLRRRHATSRATTDAPPDTGADTIVVGVFEDEGIAHDHRRRRCRRSWTPARPSAGCASSPSRTPAAGATSSPGSARATTSTPSGPAWPPRRSLGRAQGARHADAVLGGPAPRRRRARRRARRGHAAGRLRATASTRARTTTAARIEELIVSAHHDVARRGRRAPRSSPRPPTPRATCRTRPPTS